MAKKKIISVGMDVAGSTFELASYHDEISLLDWDIIVFRPEISDYLYDSRTYNGKPSLSESLSFQLKERTSHWRREINDAVESGKTVVVFLSPLQEIWVDSGKREYSGTGKNQKTTILVESFNNYQALPANLDPVATRGHAIKLASRDTDYLAGYWQEFSSLSSYRVILSGDTGCLLTKHGDKPVGRLYRHKSSSGSMLCLPDLDFEDDEFINDEGSFTPKASQFAKKLAQAIIEIDRSLQGSSELTPRPEWAKEERYKTETESQLTAELLTIEDQLKAVHKKKEEILSQLQDAGQLRNLLFEKGKPLEYAVIDALKILGFSATHYEDEDSEFDAVFESKEGRFLGEAEGRDNKPVSITKLRQLALNVHEDLERDEVDTPAKPVLFGNPFRLTAVEERKEPFTAKCLSASKTNSTALVFTPDLFLVAQYLSRKKDARFATRCRKAILNSVGLVSFPEIPEQEAGEEEKNLAVKGKA